METVNETAYALADACNMYASAATGAEIALARVAQRAFVSYALQLEWQRAFNSAPAAQLARVVRSNAVAQRVLGAYSNARAAHALRVRLDAAQ